MQILGCYTTKREGGKETEGEKPKPSNIRTWTQISDNMRHVCLAYKSYFFSQQTVFFSHNKSANSIFNHVLSAKRTGQWKRVQLDTY